MAEGLDDLLVADHLFHQRRQFAARGALQFEHAEGAAGDEVGHQQRKRRDHHHHGGDARVDAEHEAQRAHDGDDAGEELRKAHQQAFGNLVDVGDDAAQYIAVAVRVDGLEGHDLDLVHGLQADVARHAVGEAVGEQAQQVLRQRPHADGDEQLREDGHDAGKVHVVRADDEVDGVAGEDGHVERRRHRKQGKQQHQQKCRTVRGDIAKDALQRSIFALHAPFTSLSESWLKQISR